MQQKPQNLRLIAARVIDAVTDGHSLSECLPLQLEKIKEHRDRAFVQALCYGVCRFYPRLDVVLSELMPKPMKAKDSDVHALLMVGLYQLMDMQTPEHAAVSETVNAVEALKKPWARGLVNAVLRQYLREKDKLQTIIEADNEARYAHPMWLIAAIKKAWPTQWQAILDANNQHPPFSLRVNLQHESVEKYIEELKEKNLDASKIKSATAGIVLSQPVSVEELPGFAAGHVTVQDGAAQIAASLLALKPGMHVLDACAAPGGKLTHILEIEPGVKVTAIEKDKSRLALIRENLSRLKQTATCIAADAADITSWWDGKSFDCILLDAPCSASGVIRRHPDIKLLRVPSDIQALAAEQSRILAALWQTLAPGGLLVYATCSIFPAENTEVLQSFLAATPDAKEEVISADWGEPCVVGRQIFPGTDEMDGFYYACLRKD